MLDTLLLRTSLHFTQLHFTPLHYACRHFTYSHLNLTQLHFTTLSFGLTPFKFPTALFHLTSLHFTHFTSLHSPHFYSCQFTPFITAFLTLLPLIITHVSISLISSYSILLFSLSSSCFPLTLFFFSCSTFLMLFQCSFYSSSSFLPFTFHHRYPFFFLLSSFIFLLLGQPSFFLACRPSTVITNVYQLRLRPVELSAEYEIALPTQMQPACTNLQHNIHSPLTKQITVKHNCNYHTTVFC